jgi:hypothetical protein
MRIENIGQVLFGSSPGFVDVTRYCESPSKTGRQIDMGFQSVQKMQFSFKSLCQFAGVFRRDGRIVAEVGRQQNSLKSDHRQISVDWIASSISSEVFTTSLFDFGAVLQMLGHERQNNQHLEGAGAPN